MEKKSLGRGLEDISDIFISKSQESKEKKVTYEPSSADLNKASSPYQAEDQCEVEETVTFRRKIAFQNDGNAQENLRSALARHLEQGYGIRRIELKKKRRYFSAQKQAPQRGRSHHFHKTILIHLDFVAAPFPTYHCTMNSPCRVASSFYRSSIDYLSPYYCPKTSSKRLSIAFQDLSSAARLYPSAVMPRLSAPGFVKLCLAPP